MQQFSIFVQVIKATGLGELMSSQTGSYIFLAGVALSLLEGFFGYKLRKLWCVIIGFATGATAGALLGAKMQLAPTFTLVVAAALGLILAIMSLMIYHIGLFILITAVSFLLMYRFVPTLADEKLMLMIEAGIAVLLGIITLIRERLILILVTGIGGGYAAAFCLQCFFRLDMQIFLILWTMIFAIFGLFFQFKLWGGKKRAKIEDAANLDELEEENRRRRQAAKIRHAEMLEKQRAREERDRKAEQKAAARQKRKAAPKTSFGRSADDYYNESGFRRVGTDFNNAPSGNAYQQDYAAQVKPTYPNPTYPAPAASDPYEPQAPAGNGGFQDYAFRFEEEQPKVQAPLDTFDDDDRFMQEQLQERNNNRPF